MGNAQAPQWHGALAQLLEWIERIPLTWLLAFGIVAVLTLATMLSSRPGGRAPVDKAVPEPAARLRPRTVAVAPAELKAVAAAAAKNRRKAQAHPLRAYRRLSMGSAAASQGHQPGLKLFLDQRRRATTRMVG